MTKIRNKKFKQKTINLLKKHEIKNNFQKKIKKIKFKKHKLNKKTQATKKTKKIQKNKSPKKSK